MSLQSATDSTAAPLALAIEALDGNLSIAVGYATQATPVVRKLEGYSQDARLFIALDECCGDLGLTSSEFCSGLGRLGVVRGPGSYTGARLACALVNGLAITTGAPIYAPDAFHLLDIVAKDGRDHQSAGVRLLLPPSARRDFFWQIRQPKVRARRGNFDQHTLWKREIKPLADQDPFTVVGDDAPRFVESLECPDHWCVKTPRMIDLLWRALACVPASRIKGMTQHAFPLYLRPADITRRKIFVTKFRP